MHRQDALVLDAAAKLLDETAAAQPQTSEALVMAAALLRNMRGPEVTSAPPDDRTLDLERLKARLIEGGVLAPDAELKPQRAALGFSKDTYIMSAFAPDRPPESLVLRRDVSAGATRTKVVDEFPLLQRLYLAGLPIAEPLLVEPDPTVLGEAFIVTRGAAGAPDVHLWENDPYVRRAVGREIAQILARLHTTPVPPRPAPTSPSKLIAAYLDHWSALWDEVKADGFGFVSQAYDYMRHNLSDVGALALVHGDYGLQNILVDQGRVTAVIDWEFAHVGEPAEDLAYVQGRLRGLVPWSDFLSDYHAAGGPTLLAERMAFYQLWRGARNTTCCAIGMRGFESGRNPDIRLPYAWRVMVGTYANDVRQQLERLSTS